MLQNPIPVPSIKKEDEKNHLLVRQKLIDAAEGRLITVVEEFERAFDILSKYPRTVTVFGSARLPQDHPACRAAFAVSWALAKHGHAIVSGGGHGVMEAANKGAYQAGGQSIGLNIVLPHEQKPNPYITPQFCFRFHYFAIRKMHFLQRARALVAFPGGFGTLDELFETLTLLQTGKANTVPVILYDKNFWTRLINFDLLIEEGLIKAEDMQLIQFVDTPEQAWQAICHCYQL